MDLNEGNTVKALLDGLLHIANCLHSGKHTVLGLHCSPILLNEIEFAMVLGIEIAQVATPLNELLEL